MPDLDVLEKLPTGPIEAAAWLRQLAEIARRSELVNTSMRLGALARWAEGIGTADRELLEGGRLAAQVAAVAATLAQQPPAGAMAAKDAEREPRILSELKKHPEGIGPTRLAANVNLSKGTLLRVLKPLVRAKRVAQTGTGRGTRYGPVKEGL